MTDHPSTLKAEHTHSEGVDWDDGAWLHRSGDGAGLLDPAKALDEGTLAEMVARIMSMPREERRNYVVQKAGDRRFDWQDIEALAGRKDYPG